MNQASKDPDRQTLESYLLGKLDSEHSLQVEEFLRTAPDLHSALGDVPGRDSLIDALRRRTQMASAQSAAEHRPEPTYLTKGDPVASTPTQSITRAEAGSQAATWDDDDPLAVLGPSQSADELGRLGGYRVLRLLGQGGMGYVFEAIDDRLDRHVALKIMKPHVARRADARDRFLREARATAKVEHPNVTAIYQVDEEWGVVFLAMPLLKGESLDLRLKREKPLPLPLALEIARQTAAGLAAAHKTGLIHRDIKPANIWLEPGDSELAPRIRILDFGLARSVSTDVNITQSGAVIGTPAYMSPEQARGQAVDQRADLFSLGITLYEMTTGIRPFSGNDVIAILMSLGVDTPRAPRELRPTIPQSVSDFIMQLLEKDANKRPANANEVASRLGRLLAPTVETIPDIQPESQGPWEAIDEVEGAPAVLERAALPPARKKPRRGLLVGAGLLAVLLIVAVVVVIVRDKDGRIVETIEVPKGGKVEIVDDENAPPKIPKKPVEANYALQFEPGDQVVISDFPTDFGPTLTIEAYVAPTRADFRDRGAGIAQLRNVFELRIERGHWVFQAGGNKAMKAIESISAVDAGRRVHIAGVITDKERRLYVDGKFVAKGPLGDSPASEKMPATLTLGDDVFEGTIDSVRISKTARYGKQLTPPNSFVADRDTVALYRFERGAGDELKDSATHARNGKIAGAIWVQHDGTPLPGSMPMDVRQAGALQRAWAKKLNVPVEEKNGVGITMRLIPPGKYEMTPDYRVTLSKPFRIGIHEVTVGQFREFAKAKDYKSSAEKSEKGGLLRADGKDERKPEFTWKHKSISQGDNYPVGQISWNDASEFCKWLGEKEGKHYRLATEAEWEWACRAGSTGAYCFGDDEEKLDAYAWYQKNSGERTHPVGEKKPNAWGLFDMHGNICEYCQDWFRDLPSGVAVDPDGPRDGDIRTLRGYGFFDNADGVTTTSRAAYDPDGSMVHFGFRVVCEDVRPKK